jgi:hypothetical protein
MKATAVAI